MRQIATRMGEPFDCMAHARAKLAITRPGAPIFDAP